MDKEIIKKLKYPAAGSITVSIFTHMAIYFSLYTFSNHHEDKSDEVVEIEFIEPKDKATLKEHKRIVEQEKQINDEKSEDAKYLSKFDQTVKRETRAQKTGAFKNTAKPGQKVAGQKQAPKQKSQQKPKKKGPAKIKKLSDLIPKYSVTPDARNELAKHAGDPSQTDDYLQDVEDGLQTALTTREFLYYSYYNRIKHKIRQVWEPNVRKQVKMIYRKGRSIASASDRITQVLITLDSNGRLERIEVITQSGVTALDDAAIDSFKQAAPFPNPPSGMVEKDGRIRIRWDFILEANALRLEKASRYASLARP